MQLMNSRRSVYFNIGVFALVIVGFVVVNFLGSSSAVEAPVSFESAGLDRPLTPLTPAGQAHSLKDYRGAPLLLHFWASWCEPCSRDEKPLQDLFAAKGPGAHFVEIASEDRAEAIQRAGKLNAYPGDTFVDSTGDLARALSVKGYPSTIFIDKEGHVIFRGEGPLTEEDMQRLKVELTSGAANAIPPFSFADASSPSRNISSKSLEDKVWVADFIFTSCGDTCPMISEKVRALQEEFGKNPNFRIVSFSVDPETDLPERLRAFGRDHGANAAVWSFLRPPAASLQNLMVKGFRLGTADNPLVHTAKIVVVNKGNVVESYFDGDDPNAVQALKEKIRSLL